MKTEKVWEKFLDNCPEFADPESQEYHMGNEIYFKKYGGLVDSGEMAYQDALMATREEVNHLIGLQELQSQRVDEQGTRQGSGVKGRPPQFRGAKEGPKGGHPAYHPDNSYNRR